MLSRLAAASESMGVSEIARDLGMSKATVYRLLRTLVASGFVAWEPMSGRYSLSFKLLNLVEQQMRGLNLRERSVPHMRELRDLTGETVSLYVPVGLERACVEILESPQLVRHAVPMGHTMPLPSGTTGRVLLAFRDEADAARVLRECPPPQLTPDSLVDVDKYLASLPRVRLDGYFTAVNETYPGVWGVAAPIRNHTCKVVAALSVSGPSGRLSVERIAALVPTVVEISNRISADLGCRIGPAVGGR